MDDTSGVPVFHLEGKMNECAVCYQSIPVGRILCEACEADQRAEQMQEVDEEKLFKERQARAMTVE